MKDSKGRTMAQRKAAVRKIMAKQLAASRRYHKAWMAEERRYSRNYHVAHHLLRQLIKWKDSGDGSVGRIVAAARKHMRQFP